MCTRETICTLICACVCLAWMWARVHTTEHVCTGGQACLCDLIVRTCVYTRKTRCAGVAMRVYLFCPRPRVHTRKHMYTRAYTCLFHPRVGRQDSTCAHALGRVCLTAGWACVRTSKIMCTRGNTRLSDLLVNACAHKRTRAHTFSTCLLDLNVGTCAHTASRVHTCAHMLD